MMALRGQGLGFRWREASGPQPRAGSQDFLQPSVLDVGAVGAEQEPGASRARLSASQDQMWD